MGGMIKMMINKETISELIKNKKRIDGRGLTEYRNPIEIETGISWTAEGSAKVQIGETVVMAGVKLAIEKPYNDSPNEGGIMVNAELLPLSSPEYDPGPPGIKAIEIARVTDRGIRESGAIDMKKMCIEPGEKAWFVMIDIVTINDAGNLFDAASLAALSALKSARFPEIDKETGTINYKKKTDKVLPLVKEPLGVTIYKINNNLIVDPTSEEEKAYDARLTISSDVNGKIFALQKGGEMPLKSEEIDRMMGLAIEKAKLLREKMEKSL